MKGPILVCCAHNDDQVLGCGGTLANYAKKGYKIINVIFSYGESSHPWLKEKVTRDMRFREARRADKMLGIERTFYLGAVEGKFEENPETAHKLQRIMAITRPSMVFTHSGNDPHPDHKSVNRIVLELVETLHLNSDVYCFNVWNLVSIKKPVPRMIEDISSTFRLKVKAFRLHRSQKMAMLTMMPAMYARAIFSGISHGCRFAEAFEKAR
jgi:N-acetylglucosamine malate deacetylase 1